MTLSIIPLLSYDKRVSQEDSPSPSSSASQLDADVCFVVVCCFPMKFSTFNPNVLDTKQINGDNIGMKSKGSKSLAS